MAAAVPLSWDASLCFIHNVTLLPYPGCSTSSTEVLADPVWFTDFIFLKRSATYGFLNGSLYPMGFRRPGNPLKSETVHAFEDGHFLLRGQSFHQILRWYLDPKMVNRVQNQHLQFTKKREVLLTWSAVSTSSRLVMAEPGLGPQIWWFLGQHFPTALQNDDEGEYVLTNERFEKLNDGELIRWRVLLLEHSGLTCFPAKSPHACPLLQAQNRDPHSWADSKTTFQTQGFVVLI